jgi:hypothetical protein
MSKLLAAGMALALCVGTACSDARGGSTPMMKCTGCGGNAASICSADGTCASCDRCTARCAGCGGEVKATALCPKDKKCAKCDSCGK